MTFSPSRNFTSFPIITSLYVPLWIFVDATLLYGAGAADIQGACTSQSAAPQGASIQGQEGAGS